MNVNPMVSDKTPPSATGGGHRVELKSPKEIDALRISGKLAAQLLNAVCEHAKAGVTTDDLDAAAADWIRRSGAKPSFLNYRGFPKTICVSVNDEVVHGIPGQRMIEEGDIVGIDVVSDPKTLAALMRTKITKELALGCLDARNTKLESVTELHALFNVVRKRVLLNRVHVSPNAGLEFLPHTQALAKLRRLTQAVRTYRAK